MGTRHLGPAEGPSIAGRPVGLPWIANYSTMMRSLRVSPKAVCQAQPSAAS